MAVEKIFALIVRIKVERHLDCHKRQYFFFTNKIIICKRHSERVANTLNYDTCSAIPELRFTFSLLFALEPTDVSFFLHFISISKDWFMPPVLNSALVETVGWNDMRINFSCGPFSCCYWVPLFRDCVVWIHCSMIFEVFLFFKSRWLSGWSQCRPIFILSL